MSEPHDTEPGTQPEAKPQDTPPPAPIVWDEPLYKTFDEYREANRLPAT